MEETIKLLIDLFEINNNKHLAIQNQRYEDGAILRDKERKLERMIYKNLVGCDENWKTFNYKSYYDFIKKYLMENYKIEYKVSNIKTLIRELKLIELGL
jgi:hypothetical protein